jgi:TonB family protein
MPAGGSKKILQRFREWSSGGPDAMTSLFHGDQAGIQNRVWPELKQLLRHPIRFFLEERKAPKTRASLFDYFAHPEHTEPFRWREFFKDLLYDYRTAFFIPSLWSDQNELVEQRAELRTRRMESGIASVMIHVMLVGLFVYWAIRKPDPPQEEEKVVFINTPMDLPFGGDGREGGGGGGGGKNEKTPPSLGRMPETARFQFMPPDPGQPKPLMPSESPLDSKPTIQMPIDFATNSNLPIGDMTGPPGDRASSGPGSGGGIGTGTGTGIGPGRGAGYGPGEGGGMGGGRGGGIGSGVGPYVSGNGISDPIVIYNPTPPYTEEARKARTTGILTLKAVIRSNGTADGFQVVKGLGFGLDESAINTIATKWKFKPGMKDGKAVDVWAYIEVVFTIY